MYGKIAQVQPMHEGFADASALLKGGVYALVYRREVVYVGKAKRMLTRLASHMSIWAKKKSGKVPSWLPIDGIYFDAVWVRPCHPDEVDRVEREMIELYKPRLNKNLKSWGLTTAPFSITVGNVTLPFNVKPNYPVIERRL